MKPLFFATFKVHIFSKERMKINRWKFHVLALVMVGAMYSCQGAEEEGLEDLQEGLEEFEDEWVDSKWKEDGDGNFFSLELPTRMYPREDLNPEASLQYGYVEDVGGEVMEHYVIVMLEDKDSIANKEEELNLHLHLDILSYNDICLENMGGGLDTFEILTPDPEPDVSNGMDYVINEMRGSMGDVYIYYRLAVFEGERAFYQVLTWCIENQREEFEEDMAHIIESFQEFEGRSGEDHAGHDHSDHETH